MASYVYQFSEPLDMEAIAALIREHQQALPYAYLESDIEIALARSSVVLEGFRPVFRPGNLSLHQQSLELSHWQHLRIFGKAAELRINRSGQNYQALWLSETAPPSSIWQALHSDWDVQVAERRLIMLGTRREQLDPQHALYQAGNQEAIWIETRYPRPLDYPLNSQAKQLHLHCYEYSIAAVVQMSRLVDIEG